VLSMIFLAHLMVDELIVRISGSSASSAAAAAVAASASSSSSSSSSSSAKAKGKSSDLARTSGSAAVRWLLLEVGVGVRDFLSR